MGQLQGPSDAWLLKTFEGRILSSKDSLGCKAPHRYRSGAPKALHQQWQQSLRRGAEGGWSIRGCVHLQRAAHLAKCMVPAAGSPVATSKSLLFHAKSRKRSSKRYEKRRFRARFGAGRFDLLRLPLGAGLRTGLETGRGPAMERFSMSR